MKTKSVLTIDYMKFEKEKKRMHQLHVEDQKLIQELITRCDYKDRDISNLNSDLIRKEKTIDNLLRKLRKYETPWYLRIFVK